jgi:hypothetical protein
MHRRILKLKPGDGKCTDHTNHDGRDNRKINLRICTNNENLRNRPKNCNNTSGFKGVSWHKRDKKWTAQIQVNFRLKFLGYFNDRVEAAKVYNRAAIKYFGEFANLNKIKGENHGQLEN